MRQKVPLKHVLVYTAARKETVCSGTRQLASVRLQVEAPSFLDSIAQQLLHAGQQLRLLAGLPEHITGDLVAQLTASASTEAKAAAAAATSDPWAAGASGGHSQETQSMGPCLAESMCATHRVYVYVGNLIYCLQCIVAQKSWNTLLGVLSTP